MDRPLGGADRARDRRAGDTPHQPECDAIAAAGILADIAARHDTDSLGTLLEETYCVLGELTPETWHGCTHEVAGSGYPLPEADPNADPTHPFYGREICFTGTLVSMVRAHAWELVARCGGQPSEGVTKHTSILVVGYQDAYKLRPGETLSGKSRKADDLRAKGQPIELLGEPDFLRLLEL